MTRQRPFLVALLLAATSGAAGLAHQIVWTRRLVDVLGANADTFSKVIGAFFVGLALGAWLASRSRNSFTNHWQRVALAEIGVAVLAIPALFSAQLGEWVYQNAAPGWFLKLLFPLLLVTPPAMAMGLVLPWMIRALSASETFAPKQSVWLYGINTLGGVLGIGGVLLFALPNWGLLGAGLAAMSLNLLVAAGALVLNSPGSSRREEAHSSESPINQSLLKSAATNTKILAFASGFLVLAVEVILQHQLAQVSINSLFSSAIVLSMVLISLVLAAMFTPALVAYAGDSQRALRFALLAAVVLCATQPFLFKEMRNGVTILDYELPPTTYIWEVFKLGGLAICPMLIASGFVFPLLLRNAVVPGDSGNIRRVCLLFAWNGLGGWLGAELAGFLIAPQLGLWRGIVLLGGGYAILFLICKPLVQQRADRKPYFINAAAIASIVVVLGWLAGSLPQATINRTERLARLSVGREGVVATLECGPGDWRMLFNNSYTLGGSKAQFNQERQGLLPLLLHGNPKSVGVLGVASGGTTAGVALHPGVEHVDAVELSPLVLQQAKEFFGPYNRDVFADPRVRFVQEDARWVIAHECGAYDVVVGDLFLPWRTGEGRLFTREHFQNVRRSLKPDGLFCQWLPLFQLTRPQFDAIARTFQKVFPDAFLVRGDFYCELPIVGLVGGGEFSKIDWAQVAVGCARIRTGGKTADPLVRHSEGVVMMMLGPLPDPGAGPVNTLANAWLEWDAGRNILGMKSPWFIGIPAAEYVRGIQRAGNLLLPESLRAAHEAGQFFLTLEVAKKANLAAAPELELQISARLPTDLRQDGSADWRQWPSRVKISEAHLGHEAGLFQNSTAPRPIFKATDQPTR